MVFESVATPADSTSGGAFVTLLRCPYSKQHHSLVVWARTVVTATTGEIQFVIGSGPNIGTVIGGPVTISGTQHQAYGPVVVPGVIQTSFFVDVQCRVASGVGSVAVRATGIGVAS